MGTELGKSQNLHRIGVIPARWGSTRFPGKPLHVMAGKPLVQHVWERSNQCSELEALVIATDDTRIADACTAFGAAVCMTSASHPSGTDRIAEVLKHHPEATHAVNIQGDEPLIDPALIDTLSRLFVSDPDLPMATAASPLTNTKDLSDPNIVKVVLSESSRALYFSRSTIPFQRDRSTTASYFRHIGLYAYSRAFLTSFVSWPMSPLEQAESLEQLRALSHDARIQVIQTDHCAPGVDTPEQAAAIEPLLQSI